MLTFLWTPRQLSQLWSSPSNQQVLTGAKSDKTLSPRADFFARWTPEHWAYRGHAVQLFEGGDAMNPPPSVSMCVWSVSRRADHTSSSNLQWQIFRSKVDEHRAFDEESPPSEIFSIETTEEQQGALTASKYSKVIISLSSPSGVRENGFTNIQPHDQDQWQLLSPKWPKTHEKTLS